MFYINGIISKDSVLNIIFISNKNKVVFSNRGNDFYFYKEDVIISQKKQLLNNYMIDVYQHLFNIYVDKDKSDNFITSLNLNRNLLNNIL